MPEKVVHQGGNIILLPPKNVMPRESYLYVSRENCRDNVDNFCKNFYFDNLLTISTSVCRDDPEVICGQVPHEDAYKDIPAYCKYVPRDDYSASLSKDCIAAPRNKYIPEVEAYPIHQPVHMGGNKRFPWKEMKAQSWKRGPIFLISFSQS